MQLRNKGANNDDTIIDTNNRALNAAFRNDKTTLVLPFKYEYNFCDDLGRNEDVAWFP